MNERLVMLGTDPEYFMKNRSNGQLISAIPYIKGSKTDPKKMPNGGYIQADNVAVEFTTIPAKGKDAFIQSLKSSLMDAIRELPHDHDLAVLPSAEFSEEQLKDPKAQEFGCEPDYCAWELKVNDAPIPPTTQFRSCGGHIHVGALDENNELVHEDLQFLLIDMGKVDMVRGMDMFHGIVSTILDNSPAAIERRQLYGKAGCHRPTTYGVEYRVLSNYWTKTPYSSMLISSLTDDVVEVIVSGKLQELIDSIGAEDIQRIINTGNVEDAKAVLEKYIEPHLSKDSKFYLGECLAKLEGDNDIKKAWALEA